MTVLFQVELHQVSRFAPMLQLAGCIASLEGGAQLDLQGQELHIG
jgi:hypothetical protein